MPRTCSVCIHPNRNAIETEIENQRPYRNIAEQFSLTSSAIFRHKAQHITTDTATPPAAIDTLPKPDLNPENLNVMQLAFIDHYFGDAGRDGTKAARLAGYSGADNVLAVQAHKLLRLPKIKVTIAARFESSLMCAEETISNICEIARSTDSAVSVKDRLKALELVGKFHGILTETAVQERVVIVLTEKYHRVYSRLKNFFPEIEDNTLREFVGDILEVEPERLAEPKSLTA